MVLDAIGESLGWVGEVERGLAMWGDPDSSILVVFTYGGKCDGPEDLIRSIPLLSRFRPTTSRQAALKHTRNAWRKLVEYRKEKWKARKNRAGTYLRLGGKSKKLGSGEITSLPGDSLLGRERKTGYRCKKIGPSSFETSKSSR